jgi:transmembrane sensor
MTERLPWKLLDKYFKNNISDTEKQLLDNWIEESEEHALLFEELTADFKAGLPFAGSFNKDTLEAWGELRQEYDIPRYFSMPIRKLYRLAAAIMIPLFLVGGLGGFFITKGYLKNKADNTFTTVYSPGGQKTKVTLPDNSIVWLNAKTTLRYATAFNDKQRNVYIDGEAFFDVKHDSQRPFIVKTSVFNIKVYGTTFNVKAYKEEGVIEATLVKGKITIQGLKVPGRENSEIIVHPNETFRYIKDLATYKKADLPEALIKNQPNIKNEDQPILMLDPKVEVTPIVDWKNGILSFKNESFSSLSYKLEQWFDVKIQFDDPDVQEIKFTGQFEKENINQVLKYLQILTPFEYDMKVNEIHIRNKK